MTVSAPPARQAFVNALTGPTQGLANPGDSGLEEWPSEEEGR